MRHSMLKAAAIAPALLTGPAIAADAPLYQLSLHLYDGAQRVASPSLRLRAGEPAAIDFGRAGGRRYALRFTATPAADGTVLVASSVDVTLSPDRHIKADPEFAVKLGQQASIAFGAEPDPGVVRIDFTVTGAKPAD